MGGPYGGGGSYGGAELRAKAAVATAPRRAATARATGARLGITMEEARAATAKGTTAEARTEAG